MASLLWLTEFVLESSGAFFAFRRRLWYLFALLAWRASADMALRTILHFSSPPLRLPYAWSYWGFQTVQYAILYALGIQLAAKMVQEYRPLTRYVYKVVAMVASMATYVFVTTELWERKFLHAEAVSSLLLLAVVLVGWIGRKKGLEEPWRVITVGIVVACAGNALCAVCSTYSPIALNAYPIPAIAALVLWNLSVLPRKGIRQKEARLSLPKKMEPTSVRIQWKQKWMM